jgi:undecaprenyl-diphosphatase
MNFWFFIFLSILQGATEFLPVSSSGHLAIFQNLLKTFKEPPIFFDLTLHLATLFSILIYYRKKIKSYLNFNSILFLFVGTLGTGIVAFPLKEIAKEAFSSIFAVSCFLFLTGIILFFASGVKEGNKKLDLKTAFLIGLFQGFAVFPGLSRSGTTISLGLFLGLPSAVACEFSFILSIPAIAGANFLEFLNEKNIPFISIKYLLIPFITAFLVGLIFLHFTNKIFIERKLKPFSIYCIIISVLIFGALTYGKYL